MKKWNNPELMRLGLENTKDKGNERGLIFHICDYCGDWFWTHYDEIKHEATCEKNPSYQPPQPPVFES